MSADSLEPTNAVSVSTSRPVDDAFEDMFHRLWPVAVATARRLVGDQSAAEDVASEAFARALSRLITRSVSPVRTSTATTSLSSVTPYASSGTPSGSAGTPVVVVPTVGVVVGPRTTGAGSDSSSRSGTARPRGRLASWSSGRHEIPTGAALMAW